MICWDMIFNHFWFYFFIVKLKLCTRASSMISKYECLAMNTHSNFVLPAFFDIVCVRKR